MNIQPKDNKKTSTATSGSPVTGQASGTNADLTKFDIPLAVKEKHADLVTLIIETKSMDHKERQYWFHILPVMNSQQVEKLRTILLNEKTKLAEIDQKYNNPLGQPAAPVAMKDNEILDKMLKVQEQESISQKDEATKEAELLSQLENL
jgi:hypothetical protein